MCVGAQPGLQDPCLNLSVIGVLFQVMQIVRF